MFLHFHGKYNMILFVFKIFNHIQIKQSILFVFFILFLTIKENIHKTKKTKHPLPLLFTILIMLHVYRTT
jgi:hypothetical protein